MPKSQQSWVRSQHPPTQWNLRGARYAVLNKVHNLKNPKIPLFILVTHKEERSRERKDVTLVCTIWIGGGTQPMRRQQKKFRPLPLLFPSQRAVIIFYGTIKS
jgi:hypothetical protein